MKFTKLKFTKIAVALFVIATINGCKKDDVSSNEKPFMNLFSQRQAYFEIGDEHFYIYGDATNTPGTSLTVNTGDFKFSTEFYKTTCSINNLDKEERFRLTIEKGNFGNREISSGMTWNEYIVSQLENNVVEYNNEGVTIQLIDMEKNIWYYSNPDEAYSDFKIIESKYSKGVLTVHATFNCNVTSDDNKTLYLKNCEFVGQFKNLE